MAMGSTFKAKATPRAKRQYPMPTVQRMAERQAGPSAGQRKARAW